MQITSDVETVTPERAGRMLKMNKRNRPIRPTRVSALAAEMARGNWRIAQPITFARDGTLLDGQHRLAAVVESGEPVSMLVIRGVENDTFGVFDQGSKRTAGDLYSLMGGVNVNAMTATAAAMLTGGQTKGSRKYTSQDVADYTSDNEHVISHVCSSFSSLKYVTAPERAAFCNAIVKYGQDAVEPMIERLADSMFYGPKDPMNTLNRWMIDAHTRRANRKANVAPRTCYAATVLAIQACLQNRDLVVLRPKGQDF